MPGHICGSLQQVLTQGRFFVPYFLSAFIAHVSGRIALIRCRIFAAGVPVGYINSFIGGLYGCIFQFAVATVRFSIGYTCKICPFGGNMGLKSLFFLLQAGGTICAILCCLVLVKLQGVLVGCFQGIQLLFLDSPQLRKFLIKKYFGDLFILQSLCVELLHCLLLPRRYAISFLCSSISGQCPGLIGEVITSGQSLLNLCPAGKVLPSLNGL